MWTDDAGRDRPQQARAGGARPSESWWSPPEPGTEPDIDLPDGTPPDHGDDPADTEKGGYAPPRSPAYDANRRRGPHFVQSPGTPGSSPDLVGDEDVDGAVTPAAEQGPNARRGVRLLVAGLVLALVAVGAAVLLDAGEDSGTGPYEFGRVRTAGPDATVRAGGSERPLTEDHVVTAGDTVEVPAGGSIVVDMTAGGVTRAEGPARLAFLDDASDADGGAADGSRQPAIEITAGRVWVNPVDGIELVVRVPGGSATTLGNPVAVECDRSCSIEAPAAGARIDGDAGGSARPAAGEVITVETEGALALQDGTEVTDWAEANLAADASEDVPAPEPGDTDGVRASAALDGSYPVLVEIVGDPEGASLPDAVVYSSGETYDVHLAVDGSSCASAPCRIPVRAGEGSSGTAEIADGIVSLSLANPFDCYDADRTTVVEPDIGTTTIEGELTVGRVVDEDGRWLVASFAGQGSVSTTLTTPCNTGDVLGTSTSSATITSR